MKFKITEPVFGCECWVFTGGTLTFNAIVKHAKRTYSHYIGEEAYPDIEFHACVFPVQNRFAYVWFTAIPKEREESFVSIVYHEAGHVAFHMFNRLNASKDAFAGKDEEVFLYLQTFYAENILAKLFPKKKG